MYVKSLPLKVPPFDHGPEEVGKRVALNLETGEGVVLETEEGLF